MKRPSNVRCQIPEIVTVNGRVEFVAELISYELGVRFDYVCDLRDIVKADKFSGEDVPSDNDASVVTASNAFFELGPSRIFYS